jgi:hypothetical protein
MDVPLFHFIPFTDLQMDVPLFARPPFPLGFFPLHLFSLLERVSLFAFIDISIDVPHFYLRIKDLTLSLCTYIAASGMIISAPMSPLPSKYTNCKACVLMNSRTNHPCFPSASLTKSSGRYLATEPK